MSTRVYVSRSKPAATVAVSRPRGNIRAYLSLSRSGAVHQVHGGHVTGMNEVEGDQRLEETPRIGHNNNTEDGLNVQRKETVKRRAKFVSTK